MWPPPLEFSSSEHEEIYKFILVNTFKEQNDKKKNFQGKKHESEEIGSYTM